MRLTRPPTAPALCLAALLLFPAAASAAVTNRAASPDDTPRAAWLDRYQDSRQGPEQTEKVSRTVKVGDAAALDLTSIAGDVRVTGGSGSEIRIEATKRVRHRDPEEAKRLLANLRVEIAEVGDRVEVRTVYPRQVYGSRGSSSSVDFIIVVPERAAASVKTISGTVVMSGVHGEVRAETVSGDVDLTQTPNVAVAKTISGDVRAKDIGGSATLSLG